LVNNSISIPLFYKNGPNGVDFIISPNLAENYSGFDINYIAFYPNEASNPTFFKIIPITFDPYTFNCFNITYNTPYIPNSKIC